MHLGQASFRNDRANLSQGPDTWLPIFEETEEGWRGNLVSPYGYALPETVFFSKNKWEIAVKAGSTVLDIHIPRGKDLTPKDLRDSFQQACTFFAQQYPERPIQASYCHTWFFTPQLQEILGPDSSIVRFQREFYLYPFPGGPGFLWSFVFGEKYTDPATAPRDTTLRRKVLDRLAQGEELFDLPGLMFHGPDDWGTQPYFSAWNRKPDPVSND